MERKVKNIMQGHRTTDGGGVSLVRVLGYSTVDEYDPILMLDSFDSTDPKEYIAGFPLHPHRGIETISYVYRGFMTHRDSLGNEDTIGDGEVQWMTAGSGIMHEERLPAAERLLGVQLWLNLAAKDKMVSPEYISIKNEEIKEIPIDSGKVRLLSGYFKGVDGYKSKYQPLDYYDIHLRANGSIRIDTDENRSILIFTLIGDIYVGDTLIPEKTAVKLSNGEYVNIKANQVDAQILFVSSYRLDEPVAWGGPIVMNTRAELRKAFDEFDNGTFIKEGIDYSDV